MPMTYAPERSDRRQGLRIPQTRPAKIFHPAANRYLPAQTVDLSPTGLRITLPPSAALMPGTVLHVYVGSASSSPLASKRSMTAARVVWLDRSEARVEVGLHYATAAAQAATSAA